MNKNSHQVLNQIISLVTLLSFVGWLSPLAIATDTFTTPDISAATSIEAPGTDGNNILASDTHYHYVTHRFLAAPIFKPITVDIEPACFNQDDRVSFPWESSEVQIWM